MDLETFPLRNFVAREHNNRNLILFWRRLFFFFLSLSSFSYDHMCIFLFYTQDLELFSRKVYIEFIKFFFFLEKPSWVSIFNIVILQDLARRFNTSKNHTLLLYALEGKNENLIRGPNRVKKFTSQFLFIHSQLRIEWSTRRTSSNFISSAFTLIISLIEILSTLIIIITRLPLV